MQAFVRSPVEDFPSWKEWLELHRAQYPGEIKTKEDKSHLFSLFQSIVNRAWFCNDTYTVIVDDKPEKSPDILVADNLVGHLIYLSIKRNDKEPIHDWRELQEIKNAIVGPDAWGYEVYPPEDLLVDTANQYHMWVIKDLGSPFGFCTGRQVRTAKEMTEFNRKFGGNGKQRERED